MQSFKPQRGKFTLCKKLSFVAFAAEVSNPNGVNLHEKRQGSKEAEVQGVSNPNGVNLHKDAREVLRDILGVSNPNGVNLHRDLSKYKLQSEKVSNPNGVNLHKRPPLRQARAAVTS